MDTIQRCLELHRHGWFAQMTSEEALVQHPEIENNPGGPGFYAIYSPLPTSLYAHRAATPEQALDSLVADLVRGGMVRELR